MLQLFQTPTIIFALAALLSVLEAKKTHLIYFRGEREKSMNFRSLHEKEFEKL